jgi:hypothetical protein
MDLALRSNQLLPEHGVLRQKGSTSAEEVSDQSEAEPQEIDHPCVIARLARGRSL